MVTPTDYRKLELSQLAEAVAMEYFPDGLILPQQIAFENKITFSYGDYDDCFDGLLQHRSGKFHIFLNLTRNPDKNSARMRYTFSHELGHYYIDEHRNALKSGRTVEHGSLNALTRRNLAEWEADYFASCLLIPTGKIRKYCLKRPLSSALISDISTDFQVSSSATIFRYLDLSLFPMMIVMAKDGKVEWKMNTRDFKYWQIPAKEKPVPSASVSAEFFTSGKKYHVEETVFAEDWFNDRYVQKGEQFNEKCYYLPGNKVMSLLWKKERR